MLRSSSSLLPNLHPVPLLSRMCIGLAPILPSLLPFTSLLSCITFQCYTSQHWPQSWNTPQQWPFLHYFSSCMTSVRPNKSSTTHLAPQHYLYYPIPHSVPSLWLGIEPFALNRLSVACHCKTSHKGFVCVCVLCVVAIGQASHSTSPDLDLNIEWNISVYFIN